MVELLNGGGYAANTYLYILNGSAILIDASATPREISKMLKKYDADLDFIMITHAHYDHLLYYDEILAAFPTAKLCAGAREDKVFCDPSANASELFGDPRTYYFDGMYLKDNDDIAIVGSMLKVMNTPGHTPGSLCFLDERNSIMFTGDTIFAEGGYGRTDFKYGSPFDMQKSLARLSGLDENITFYPGHGPSSRIGWEF